jgi:predicted acetyltransferase
MNDIVIRALTDFEERAGVVHALGSYAFEPSPPPVEREKWEKWLRNLDDATILAAFEGERPAAMACSSPMTQNVRGSLVPMAGIWGVATHPAARRNGLVRRLMGDLLARERAAGMPVTCLYPFRPSFYERLGYVPFPQPRTAKIDPRPLLPLLKMDLGGVVELLPMAEGHAIYRAYLQAHQPRVHGLALVSESGARNEADQKVWLAVARVAGTVEGVMIYRNTGKEDDITMDVWRFYAHTVPGRMLLLEWFARHMDQIKIAAVRLPPTELPETWWPDLATLQTERVWPPMGRVLDVARIGGMEAGPGAITVRISDALCPWNEGVWALAGVDGSLVVTTAAGTPDCSLTIQGLSALVYGGYDPDLFELRGWGDAGPAAQAALRAIFPPRLPYLHEEF